MNILDACCGSKMFWFDREHEETVYMDNRTLETTLCDGRKLIVKPDVVADFRKMPYVSNVPAKEKGRKTIPTWEYRGIRICEKQHTTHKT